VISLHNEFEGGKYNSRFFVNNKVWFNLVIVFFNYFVLTTAINFV